jgi:excisionase family DNA binding protein
MTERGSTLTNAGTTGESKTKHLQPKWYSPAEVAELLGYGLSKVKMKIATGELRSIKDGKYRRILPQWVDQYVQDQVDRQEAA